MDGWTMNIPGVFLTIQTIYLHILKHFKMYSFIQNKNVLFIPHVSLKYDLTSKLPYRSHASLWPLSQTGVNNLNIVTMRSLLPKCLS